MDFESVGWAAGALILGCALRTLLPYLTTGLKVVGDSGKWSDWPHFEPAYLSSFALAIILYSVTFLTVPGAWEVVLTTPFVALTGIAYAGQDMIREVIKGVSGVRGLVRGE